MLVYRIQTATTLLAVIAGALLFDGRLAADPIKIAFLATEPSVQNMGPHNQAAWETAQTLGAATLLLAAPDGEFHDASGTPRDLAGFNVVWYHQGDAILRSELYAGKPLAAIRAFAEAGGGVLLSGGALAMVAPLGLETEIRPQRHELDNYRDPAAMVLVERAHPAFIGLQELQGQVPLSRGGCPAVADFYWGGPAEGMVLANTPEGVHRPLVEYGIGAGRIVVFGGRWSDYADVENPHRPNLLKLTSNLLTYLANASTWRPVIIASAFPPLAFPDEPGIAQPRWRALQMAIEDLSREFPDQYPHAGDYLRRLNILRAEQEGIPRDAGVEAFASIRTRFDALQRDALLTNPLINFEHLLFIRRRADNLGLPRNFHGNDDLSPIGYGNTLTAVSMKTPDGEGKTIFTPPTDQFIGDIDLHYDAEKLLMSIPDEKGRWGIAELNLTSGNCERIPLIEEPDVHNYDACYLPDDRIIFTSTAPFIGVPCIGGQSKVANLYLFDHDKRVRRLTNDQDHNWCPAVLNNGRILYQRWEYADIAHTFTRLLFHANPDGSGQMEYYGSNSFWPTAMFYARPVPGHPTKVIAVVGGHHDAPRQGELVLFDPALGRHEADGAVQRIPGFGQAVKPVILDGLIGASWPRFLHPFPLSEKYFLVSCKPSKNACWGLYLVDIFDNFLLLREEPGWALFEPTPWRKTPRQPLVPDLANPAQKEATVLLLDVYRGPGLEGVPRGTVKSLRLISYDFTFHGLGGEPDRVGLDGPWDVKRILGTVPVESDGSAHFQTPAGTPISIQPLDAEGKALALMRSWFTAVPGETVSCVGCHEKQNMAPPANKSATAFCRAPSSIKPWYGPARGFSFEREVQPVLDAYCAGCHNGDAKNTFDLTAGPAEKIPSAFEMHFSPSYMELRRWVHTPTLESDAHLLPPRAFHADTSDLVQILRDGHYGVQLNEEAWDRLITWIDLNAPFHGSWREVAASNPTKLAAAIHGADRRRQLNIAYAGFDEDPEAIYPAASLQALSCPQIPTVPSFAGTDMQTATSVEKPVLSFELAEGINLDMVQIDPGQCRIGTDNGYPNERPAHTETIEKPFLLGRFEISNRQYRCFNPTHDSGLETGEVYQFGDDERGFTLNRPEQPVVRVSWSEAMAFCDWLSLKTGRRFSLPTETQWEYACGGGSTTPMSYGTLDDDFSRYANLSDATHHSVYYPHVPNALPPWRPADIRFDDKWRVSAPIGSFEPNPWGLFDMHGNVAEWTESEYRLSPPLSIENAADNKTMCRKVVRGGSWMDCPKRARTAYRLHYEPSQQIHDVGFRVVCEITSP